MGENDFRNIMENGFCVDYEGNDSKVRCFKCGEYSELVNISGEWKMCCNNQHEYELVDWVIEHINMRDGVAKAFLNGECNFIKS